MVAIYPPRVHDALIVRIACFVRFHVVHLRLIACVRFDGAGRPRRQAERCYLLLEIYGMGVDSQLFCVYA
jgi:hypothetical protein